MEQFCAVVDTGRRGAAFIAADAVWVAGEGIEPTILFVDFAKEPRWWPGETDSVADLPDVGLGIELDGDGRASWINGDEIRFTPRSDTPDQPQSCEAPASESRIDWSQTLPVGANEILALDAGIDGCFELELQGLIGGPYLWYLCAPADAVPFAAGDFIWVDSQSGSGARELTLTLLDPLDLEPATDPNGAVLLQVRLLRGGNDPQFVGPALGRELESVPASGCPWLLEDGCANAERYVGLRVVGAQNTLQPGVAVGFADTPGPGAKVRTAILAYVRQRAVVDGACSEGSNQLTHDIDIAIVQEPLL